MQQCSNSEVLNKHGIHACTYNACVTKNVLTPELLQKSIKPGTRTVTVRFPHT